MFDKRFHTTRLMMIVGFCPYLLFAIEANLPGIEVSPIHTFQANEGKPRAGLILAPDGKLYGTTYCRKDSLQNITFGGAVYQFDPSSNQFALIHTFSLPEKGRNSDGACPLAPLSVGSDGLLYGTTEFGGAGAGVLFRFNPADPTTFANLHNFGTATGQQIDGAYPLGGAVPDGRGNFYGATHSGVIYKWDGLSVTPVHVFAGVNLYGSPAFGRDGKLYGATFFGGTYGRGFVYSLDPATKAFQAIYNFEPFTFTGNGDNTPVQSLFLASDGALYGTNEFGGPSGNGFVWKLSGGQVSILHNFSSYSTNPRFSNQDGGQPLSTLTEGTDGLIYGTTFYGGTNAVGTIFRIAKDGSGFESLYSFASNTGTGAYPYSGLTRMPDGSMIGTTFIGGAAIYRLTFPPSVAIQPAAIKAIRTGRGIVSGAASAVVLNGQAPFSYAWSVDVGTFTIHTPSAQTTTVSAVLAACDSIEGTLSVTVTDANGRSASASAPLTFSATSPPHGFCD